MALKSATCNCGRGLATEKVAITVRVMGQYRDEERVTQFCKRCAAATIENGLGRAA